MQTTLPFITSETFRKVRQSIALNAEKEKDNYIAYLEKVVAGQLAWINQNRVKLKK